MSTVREVPLTAAELRVMRDPDQANTLTALATVELTLVELLAWRVLELRQDDHSKHPISDQIVPTARPIRLDPPHLRTMFDIVKAAAQSGRGASLIEIMRQLTALFGPQLIPFQNEYVRAALLERGLLELRNERSMLMFPVTRHRPTAAGEQTLARLRDQLRQARGLRSLLLKRDQRQALELALSLGSVGLLLSELRPYYTALSEELVRSGITHSTAGTGFFWISRAPEIARVMVAFNRITAGQRRGSDGPGGDSSDSDSDSDSGGGSSDSEGSGGGDSGGWGSSSDSGSSDSSSSSD